MSVSREQLVPALRARECWIAFAVLLVVYCATLAPDVTWWDAGEFIAAFHAWGIPHPPGTPIFVASGHLFALAFGGALGFARAANLFSALCTALAGGLTAALVAASAAEQQKRIHAASTAAGLCAGLGTTAWSNATETEIYAFALLYVLIVLLAAFRMHAARDGARRRWRWCVAYLLAFGPVIHLSVLLAAPAVILLGTTGGRRGERLREVLLLGGAAIAAAGVGRTSPWAVGAGLLFMLGACMSDRRDLVVIALWMVASSAWIMLPLRALDHPAINQGNPATISALLDVIGRRQYESVPFWPRRAPLWIQLAAIPQYMDWQFAMSLGRGVFTTPTRVAVAFIFGALGLTGLRELRRTAPVIAGPLIVLFVSGSLGACLYLNLKAGNSIGYGLDGITDHEARERDYFYVLAFWPWGIFAACGAARLARRYRLPSFSPVLLAVVPLAGNWHSVSRSQMPEAGAAAYVAQSLLNAVPKNGVLFVAGDNDTYPLWYEQEVHALRRDVTVVTLPLLPADWYYKQLSAAIDVGAGSDTSLAIASVESENRAGRLAFSARIHERPVAATTQLTPHERDLLGSDWILDGAIYRSRAAATQMHSAPSVREGIPASDNSLRFDTRLPDDVSAGMLATLRCSVLAASSIGKPARDSVAERCNFR